MIIVVAVYCREISPKSVVLRYYSGSRDSSEYMRTHAHGHSPSQDIRKAEDGKAKVVELT